jgi:CRISPR-associated protein Cas2
MLVLITYDIKTDSAGGPKRLRNIAKTCLDFGQRVQYSVFECDISPAQWTELRARLVNLIDPATDSLRFYMLGSNWRKRIEHIGAKPATDFEAPLIF